MRNRIALISLMALCMTIADVAVTKVRAFDDAIYPDLRGQWNRAPVPGAGQPAFDPNKPFGLL